MVNWYVCSIDCCPIYKVHSNPRLLPAEFGKALWGQLGVLGPRGASLRWSLYCCCLINSWEKSSQIKRRSQGCKVDVDGFFFWIWLLSNWGVLSELRFLANSANSSVLMPLLEVVICKIFFSKLIQLLFITTSCSQNSVFQVWDRRLPAVPN